MKTIALIIAAISFSAVSLMAQPKYTSNALNSNRNYKTGGNGKASKDKTDDKEQACNYNNEEKSGQQSSANYKNSFAKSDKNSGGEMLVVPAESGNSFTASSNYKMQFKGSKKNKKATETEQKQEPVVLKTSEE